MRQKIEAIGPYTPGHRAPHMLESPAGAVPCFIHCVVGDTAFLTVRGAAHPTAHPISKIWNAREVPVAREFWVNEYEGGCFYAYSTEEDADSTVKGTGFIRTIHVREVLPGESE